MDGGAPLKFLKSMHVLAVKVGENRFADCTFEASDRWQPGIDSVDLEEPIEGV